MPETLTIKRELEIPKPRGLSSSARDKLIHAFFFLNGMLSVIALIGIFGLLVYTAIPAFQEINLWHFLTGAVWNPTSYYEAKYGIVPMLVSTMMVTFGALLIAIPLGIGTAAYLSDVAGPRTREIIKPVIEILAGIPSVVVGFLGIVLVGPLIAKLFGTSNGLNAINGSILLGVMALPTIISISEDALNSVPKTYDQASLALGATRWQTVIRVKIPAAMSGIIAACMLGMGRAIGETMTVLMATGCAPAMPEGFLESVRTLTSSIAIELGEVAYNTTHYYALFALGLVLFVITFLINLTSDIVLHRYEKVNR
ncbi:MAG: phosphate ABC transporter permease subunit PstC [Candidatus Omnitrophica bacterium]|nr:phosphate ABC transporter permease subunit PstC [Candidatus Omnitrophota bacterium]MCB9720974.1 phosphate ABC transporter permease subunit PstC [Candidatus Omnitrophota bacterium]